MTKYVWYAKTSFHDFAPNSYQVQVCTSIKRKFNGVLDGNIFSLSPKKTDLARLQYVLHVFSRNFLHSMVDFHLDDKGSYWYDFLFQSIKCTMLFSIWLENVLWQVIAREQSKNMSIMFAASSICYPLLLFFFLLSRLTEAVCIAAVKNLPLQKCMPFWKRKGGMFLLLLPLLFDEERKEVQQLAFLPAIGMECTSEISSLHTFHRKIVESIIFLYTNMIDFVHWKDIVDPFFICMHFFVSFFCIQFKNVLRFHVALKTFRNSLLSRMESVGNFCSW